MEARCSHAPSHGAHVAQGLSHLGGYRYLFGLDERNARRSLNDVLALLERVATFPLERRVNGKPGRALVVVIAAAPVTEFLIDSREQRIRRPTGEERQRPPTVRAR